MKFFFILFLTIFILFSCASVIESEMDENAESEELAAGIEELETGNDDMPEGGEEFEEIGLQLLESSEELEEIGLQLLESSEELEESGEQLAAVSEEAVIDNEQSEISNEGGEGYNEQIAEINNQLALIMEQLAFINDRLTYSAADNGGQFEESSIQEDVEPKIETEEKIVQTEPRAPPLPLPALLVPSEERVQPREQQPAREQERNVLREQREAPPIPSPSQSVILPRETEIDTGQEIVFSRIVRATVGQIIEVPFRGNGWIYMGEIASRRGIDYRSSRRDPEGQSFLFRADAVGFYVLRFFREDFLRGYVLNDHVQVVVGDRQAGDGAAWFNPPIDQGRVIALPRWPSSLDEAAIQRGRATESVPQGTQEREQFFDANAVQRESILPENNFEHGTESFSSGQTDAAMQNADSSAEDFLLRETSFQEVPESIQFSTDNETEYRTSITRERPEILLQGAKDRFNQGNVTAAISLLDQYKEYYGDDNDELYWLYGQFYEANFEYRDILLSLDYYRRLVREYPQSGYATDARRRIAYLERFYINIQ